MMSKDIQVTRTAKLAFDLSALRGFKLEFNMIRILQPQAT